jgi:hypothetical protein
VVAASKPSSGLETTTARRRREKAHFSAAASYVRMRANAGQGPDDGDRQSARRDAVATDYQAHSLSAIAAVATDYQAHSLSAIAWSLGSVSEPLVWCRNICMNGKPAIFTFAPTRGENCRTLLVVVPGQCRA